MSKLRLERWSPALGAEVLDLDLVSALCGNDESAEATVDALYGALIDHQVLFFRNQPLTPELHVRLGQLFGDLAPRHHSYNTLPEYGDVAVLDWQPGDRPDASEWHSDMTFREKPPFASILKAVIVPPVGGDTLWASMYSVYDSLDPGFRRDLEGMQICHDPGQFRNEAYDSAGNQGITDMMVSTGSAVWPIVSHHPVTEQPYVNVSESNSRWIMGMGAGESQRIVNYLLDAINRPDHQVRLRWRPDTIAIWDNRGSQHYAVADYPTYRRGMHRVAVDTDRRLEQRVAERSTITMK